MLTVVHHHPSQEDGTKELLETAVKNLQREFPHSPPMVITSGEADGTEDLAGSYVIRMPGHFSQPRSLSITINSAVLIGKVMGVRWLLFVNSRLEVPTGLGKWISSMLRQAEGRDTLERVVGFIDREQYGDKNFRLDCFLISGKLLSQAAPSPGTDESPAKQMTGRIELLKVEGLIRPIGLFTK